MLMYLLFIKYFSCELKPISETKDKEIFLLKLNFMYKKGLL